MINKNNTINQRRFNNIRNNFIVGLVGINKTGKSTTARTEIVEPWRNARDSRYQIFGHDPQRMFDGLIPRTNLIDPEDKNWALKCCELRNCCLILDEIGILHPSAQHPPRGFKKLFAQCFFWNIDIVWMTHNPALIPEICTYHTTKYYLFLTLAREGSFQKKISNYTLCTAGSNYVNKYVKNYGRGKHHLDPEYNGQGFPYVIVDCETQKLTGVNMKKPI